MSGAERERVCMSRRDECSSRCSSDRVCSQNLHSRLSWLPTADRTNPHTSPLSVRQQHCRCDERNLHTNVPNGRERKIWRRQQLEASQHGSLHLNAVTLLHDPVVHTRTINNFHSSDKLDCKDHRWTPAMNQRRRRIHILTLVTPPVTCLRHQTPSYAHVIRYNGTAMTKMFDLKQILKARETEASVHITQSVRQKHMTRYRLLYNAHRQTITDVQISLRVKLRSFK